jgi:hypothetical protein
MLRNVIMTYILGTQLRSRRICDQLIGITQVRQPERQLSQTVVEYLKDVQWMNKMSNCLKSVSSHMSSNQHFVGLGKEAGSIFYNH